MLLNQSPKLSTRGYQLAWNSAVATSMGSGRLKRVRLSRGVGDEGVCQSLLCMRKPWRHFGRMFIGGTEGEGKYVFEEQSRTKDKWCCKKLNEKQLFYTTTVTTTTKPIYTTITEKCQKEWKTTTQRCTLEQKAVPLSNLQVYTLIHEPEFGPGNPCSFAAHR